MHACSQTKNLFLSKNYRDPNWTRGYQDRNLANLSSIVHWLPWVVTTCQMAFSPFLTLLRRLPNLYLFVSSFTLFITLGCYAIQRWKRYLLLRQITASDTMLAVKKDLFSSSFSVTWTRKLGVSLIRCFISACTRTLSLFYISLNSLQILLPL